MGAPVTMGMLFMVAYNLVDTYFIGLLHDDYQLAASNLAYPVMMVLIAISGIVGNGGASYIARCMGAGAVLLIVALLDAATLAAWLGRCEALGLAALVETHDEAEIDTAVRAGARIIGVNNRNLKDFSVDLGNAARLRDRVPPDCLFVAESGVRGPEDVARLRRLGADAVLVGEALMRAEDKKARLRELKGEP